ncbi:hypothetical protein GGI07_004131 [Coemansia sp. Benny D115]|nr:hypothetical protein GGI07_004131 [Coemansia sp. Benny D115]
MSPNSQHLPLFPAPRLGSELWRRYWQDRREHGDACVHCLDTISEFELLLGLSHGAPGFYASSSSGGQTDGAMCGYRQMRGFQDKQWANSIADSIPDIADERNHAKALAMLDQALGLDPQCRTALLLRADVYIRQERVKRARLDIEQLTAIERGTGHGDNGLLPRDIQLLRARLARLSRPSRRHGSADAPRRRPRSSRSPSRSRSRSRSGIRHGSRFDGSGSRQSRRSDQRRRRRRSRSRDSRDGEETGKPASRQR